MEENRKKSFEGIITKEEYYSLDDQEQFEKDNEVMVEIILKYPSVEDISGESIDEFSPVIVDDIELENEEEIISGKNYIRHYILNPELKNQIYEFYLYSRRSYFGHETEINKINLKIHTALNIEKKAQILKQEYDNFTKKLNKLVPKEERINPKLVSAHSLDFGGKKKNLIDKETGLISQNYLDDVSNKISTEFGKLLDLEF